MATLDSFTRERVRDAVYRSLTAEFATASGDRPVTFPATPFYDDDRGVLVVSSPPAFAGKVDAARSNPRVSLLLDGKGGRVLVRGRATVRDDDLRANAAYVRERIEAEPVGPKRDAFLRSSAAQTSEVGRFLFDWYALRIVVEVEPEHVERLGVPGRVHVPPWPAVGMDESEATEYDRATFTVVEDGFPVTRPIEGFTVSDGKAHIERWSGPVEDGRPGCLLVHWHDDDVSRLGQRVVRGRCRADEGTLLFDPGSSFTLRNASLLDTLRFVWEGKRRTGAYFGVRNPLGWRW
ncbi:pyridoxamine 5'-phosphate oxidase family protein [Halomarina litorea]|uniref:pyridoxamine 5'-phosphate oxidase family protein n=1 Tax=Halomarina litorea TaxID=2961595 RepID=UPI0020C20017|nr:pyridoxamine 5'-phosphate oxidase family protein [Halomarina sp. BCD28]